MALQEIFGRVQRALSNQSTLIRKLEPNSGAEKGSALMDCLETLEDLRALLNSPNLETGIVGTSLEADCFQWALAATELTESIGEQLVDYEPDAFARLMARLQEHTRVFKRVLIDGKRDEPLVSVARFFGKSGQGLEFWTSNFGNQFAVEFSEIKDKLEQLYPTTSRRTWTQLESSLEPDVSGRVTAQRFAEFLEGFGQDIGRALEQLTRTLSESFFAGFVSYNETEALLQDCNPGSFLVRFSASRPCGLVLARKVADPATGTSRVVQTLMISRNGGFELEGRLFANLSDVTSAFPDERLTPAPTVRSIARARFFKGFLSREETVACLQSKRSGTFLFRFSATEPGALVVGYKEDDVVKQTRVLSMPERGGYQLAGSDVLYPTIEEIVIQNSHRLRYAVDDADSEIDARSGDQGEQYSALRDRYGGINGLDYGRLDNLMQ